MARSVTVHRPVNVVFCRLMSPHSKESLHPLSQAFPLTLCLPLCILLLWCRTVPRGHSLFLFFRSFLRENEGTPAQNWGVSFFSLKIIGLCSIKAQRCSFWCSWLSVFNVRLPHLNQALRVGKSIGWLVVMCLFPVETRRGEEGDVLGSDYRCLNEMTSADLRVYFCNTPEKLVL